MVYPTGRGLLHHDAMTLFRKEKGYLRVEIPAPCQSRAKQRPLKGMLKKTENTWPANWREKANFSPAGLDITSVQLHAER